MRVYSQSQGQVIDVPDGATSFGEQQSMGNMGTPTSTQTGGSMANLRQLLGMYALTKSKKISDMAAAFQLMQPTAQEDKATETRGEVNKTVDKIDRAIKLLESKKVKTGFVAGRVLKLKTQVLDNASPEEREAYRLLGEVEAQKMFEIGGKVLPAQEMERLQTFLPDFKKPNATNIGDLKEWRNSLTKYGLGATTTTGGTTTGGISTGNTADDLLNEAGY